jgi:hypothetical protein
MRTGVGRSILGGALLCLAFGVGCGGNKPALAEVEGVLVWNGAPLENVQVEFIPDAANGTQGLRSSGVTDQNGRFSLRCDDGRPGAVVGRHCVVLLDVGTRAHDRERDPRKGGKAVKALPDPAPGSAERALPSKYQSAASTPLRRDVKAGPQKIELKLP